MSKRLVMFHTPGEIEDFANKVSKYPYDMDLKMGRFVVDAKSILGLMNVGVKHKVEFMVNESDDHLSGLWQDINQYIAM